MPEINQSNLLIVDDDPMNRDILFRHLKNLGYQNIILADSGEKGLEIVALQQIDLILLDMMMPVMNGLEMLMHLKACEDWRVIPVIIVSALDEKEMMLSCIQYGAEDYLIKPYDRVFLKVRVSACLEKKIWLNRCFGEVKKGESPTKHLAKLYPFS